ncbi:four helix bundle protein [Deefgea piscis]|uniref:four helix bundle protein n=1 Tax=Deefgea piscis TaxID=2739061 RepID=UPI001C7F1878|nr:four helix bundle protein [Deefgea piscis]QZA80569.1 four helix bundle protein [Deefgea piscis]
MEKTHKQLEVWIQAMLLVQMIYQITATYPREELFSLTNQMRRAVVSIPSNIAEGVARGSTKEYVHFLNIARGSLAELDTQLEISKMLEYLPAEHPVFNQISTTARLLTGLHKKMVSLI